MGFIQFKPLQLQGQNETGRTKCMSAGRSAGTGRPGAKPAAVFLDDSDKPHEECGVFGIFSPPAPEALVAPGDTAPPASERETSPVKPAAEGDSHAEMDAGARAHCAAERAGAAERAAEALVAGWPARGYTESDAGLGAAREGSTGAADSTLAAGAHPVADAGASGGRGVAGPAGAADSTGAAGPVPIPTPRLVYYGLYSLQHRGQESAGIVINNDGILKQHRGMGLVAEVFDDSTLDNLQGNSAIGHVRYSTAGSSTVTNAQPLLAQSKLGAMAIAHNGNLVNAGVIRDLLEDAGVMFQTTSDSEVILNLVARGARRGLDRSLLDAMRAIQGSFSLVMLAQDALIAVRDPKGIRPLCLGKLNDSWIVASETCSLDAVGAELVRDVEPGEILIIDSDGVRSLRQHERTEWRVCSFEFVYFSRPDSVVDNVSVYQSRTRAGHILWEESPVEADVVSGVPDSGVVAAHGLSEAAGIPYAMTLIKNKYVGRSFIAPTQELRERAVSVKLNVLRGNVQGKRVVLVDDSIVRGTTMRRLVTMLKRAGAKEVHIRIASPPVKFPCYFGMDYPSREELAGVKSVEDVRRQIGADSLAYLSLDGLHRALGGTGRFCMGCLTGVYPIAAPLEQRKEHLEGEEAGADPESSRDFHHGVAPSGGAAPVDGWEPTRTPVAATKSSGARRD